MESWWLSRRDARGNRNKREWKSSADAIHASLLMDVKAVRVVVTGVGGVNAMIVSGEALVSSANVLGAAAGVRLRREITYRAELARVPAR